MTIEDELRTHHDFIYLQFDEPETTWRSDRINDSDVEYVRADRVKELEKRIADLEKDQEMLDWLIKYHGWFGRVHIDVHMKKEQS